jgi:hypothetical protein
MGGDGGKGGSDGFLFLVVLANITRQKVSDDSVCGVSETEVYN